MPNTAWQLFQDFRRTPGSSDNDCDHYPDSLARRLAEQDPEINSNPRLPDGYTLAELLARMKPDFDPNPLLPGSYLLYFADNSHLALRRESEGPAILSRNQETTHSPLTLLLYCFIQGRPTKAETTANPENLPPEQKDQLFLPELRYFRNTMAVAVAALANPENETSVSELDAYLQALNKERRPPTWKTETRTPDQRKGQIAFPDGSSLAITRDLDSQILYLTTPERAHGSSSRLPGELRRLPNGTSAAAASLNRLLDKNKPGRRVL